MEITPPQHAPEGAETLPSRRHDRMEITPPQHASEGAGAFRPLKPNSKTSGFSHGPSSILPGMRLAPQETRTYSVTAQRRRIFQVTATAELLLQTLIDYRRQGKFLLHAFVIMPDHLHALITPAPDVSLEKAMQFIKGGFSFRLKSNADVWLRSFNETQISSCEKFANCVRYIEDNPVRRALAPTPQAYPFSSAAHAEAYPIPHQFSA
jgi:putative transposase